MLYFLGDFDHDRYIFPDWHNKKIDAPTKKVWIALLILKLTPG